ncbi:MAG: hypothetical protein M3025_03365 [Actinomycetota bacterium]|nr:hypothetical protein [Actinomycetota bacterium]
MTEQPQSPQEGQPSPDQPVDQPPHVDDPAEGEHLSFPEPGYPTEETQPPDGLPDRPHEHPEEIGETTPDKQSSP